MVHHYAATIIDVVGITVLSSLLFQFALWVYGSFFARINLSKYRRPDQTAWAVITGSSDGIGLGFAEELASHGFNVLLVGRNQEKVERVKERLQTAFPTVQFDHVLSNATDTSPENIARVVDKAKSRDVALLVNNVGIIEPVRGRVHELGPDVLTELVTVNCTYPILLTQAMLPLLRARKDGQSSCIINISSIAAFFRTPFGATYSGSKAFNRMWSNSLAAEYYPLGIDVVTVCPGLVVSNIVKMRESVFCCSARNCARYSLQRMSSWATDFTPYPGHGITLAAVQAIMTLPNRILLPHLANATGFFQKMSLRSSGKTE